MPAPFSPGASFLTKLYDQTLAATAASIDTGAVLSGGFSALQAVLYARGDTGSSAMQAFMTFNGDAGSNYDYATIRNTGGGAGFSAAVASASIWVGYFPAASATANFIGCSTITIPNYTGSLFKACFGQFGFPNSTGSNTEEVELVNGQWRSTSAINRLAIAAGAGNFVAGSRLLIYGLP